MFLMFTHVLNSYFDDEIALCSYFSVVGRPILTISFFWILKVVSFIQTET